MLDGEQIEGFKLRSMGQAKTCSDTETLMKVAEEHGVSPEDALSVASLSLSKLAGLVVEGMPREEKAEKKQNFLDACEDAGIVQKSPERFSVVEVR